jgi:signal transduction histidine kinase
MRMRGLSVRTKVFLLFAGAALLTVVPALVLISRAVEERVYERATEDLRGASEALRSYWSVQDEALQEVARRVARERRVADLLQQGDTAALGRILTREVGAGRVVLAADTLGRPLVGPALDSTTLRAGGSVVIVPETGEAPVRVAVWPVFAETDSAAAADSLGGDAAADSLAAELPDSFRVGIVGVGTRLDARVIGGLKDLTAGTEVALVVGDSVVATTLPDSLARIVEELDLPAVVERGGIWRRQVEKLPYLYYASALPARQTPTAVLLFRPVAQELRLALGIRQSLLGIGFLALVLALGLALIVARIVARPAQVLAAAASDLARGNFHAPLPSASGDEIGQLTRAFGEMRSAIAEREARLRSAQAELIHREKLAAMGRLVAQLSHEINNPIYNIQNCLEVLDRRGDPNDPNREFLELAREELSRMAVLTRQMLDQSRPLSDAASPLDLNQLAQRVLTLARPDLEAHGIRTELLLARELPQVIAHPDALQQVLANLVDNAVDAMPGGGVLRLATAATDDAVEVVVEDTGPGIPGEHLPHIFEAFYTTKPGVRGIGLGLFVSEGIIRGHRGRLSVESRVGEGSRFVVQLPREILDPAIADDPAREPNSAAAV